MRGLLIFGAGVVAGYLFATVSISVDIIERAEEQLARTLLDASVSSLPVDKGGLGFLPGWDL